MKYNKPAPGKYLIAVSGGVDSMALMHLLQMQKDLELVVAHFDHGIRDDSHEDMLLVKKVAEQYGLNFIENSGNLGENTSEDQARTARYEFLRRVKNEVNAKKIITAHHADDVIETMIINLIRGTGWRGLCSLKETNEISRPFLDTYKTELIEFATQHQLAWREDSTNADTKFLRNQVRASIASKLNDQQRKQWLEIYKKQLSMQPEIEREIEKLKTNRRYNFIMWPQLVALEILKSSLGLTRPQAALALTAVKTSQVGAETHIGSGKKLRFTRDNFVVLSD